MQCGSQKSLGKKQVEGRGLVIHPQPPQYLARQRLQSHVMACSAIGLTDMDLHFRYLSVSLFSLVLFETHLSVLL